MRLDLYLLTKIPTISRTYAKKAILDGLVTVNSKRSYPSYKLKDDDAVLFNEIEIKNFYKNQQSAQITQTKIAFEILFEDNEILVVNKPAGLDAHPVPNNMNNTLLNGVMYYLNETKQFSKPRLVHRLDKDTSGIMIIAKTYNSNKIYSKYFELGKVKKYYLALVKNISNSGSGFYDKSKIEEICFLARCKHDRHKMCYTETSNGKLAITEFTILGKADKFKTFSDLENEIFIHVEHDKLKFHTSLEDFFNYIEKYKYDSKIVLAQPKTGRTHQIRVQLEHLGIPIIGDKLYSSVDYPRMMLHAWGLGLEM